MPPDSAPGISSAVMKAFAHALELALELQLEIARAAIDHTGMRLTFRLEKGHGARFLTWTISGVGLFACDDANACALVDAELDSAAMRLRCSAAAPRGAQALECGEPCEQHFGAVIVAINDSACEFECSRGGRTAHKFASHDYYYSDAGPVLASQLRTRAT